MHIFEFLDYRKYLDSYYKDKKKSKSNFSYKKFSEDAGLSSPAHLPLVINGKRNLGIQSLTKFAQGLGLKGKEKLYFEKLVLFNQTKDPQQKDLYLAQLQKLRERSKASFRLNFRQQNSLFSTFAGPIIFEMVVRKDFKEDPEWISQKTKGLLSVGQVQESLLKLERTGLLLRDESGTLKPVEYLVYSQDEVENLFIRSYHRKMMEVAAKKIDDSVQSREFGFLTVSSNPEKFALLKNKIKDFLKQANEELTDSSGATKTYQLNVQMFEIAD